MHLMDDSALIVFLKIPEKGKVKTRLAKELDDDFVLELYKGFICDLLETLSPVKNKLLFVGGLNQKEVAIAPGNRPEIKALLESFIGKGYKVFPQNGQDLGEKMANAFDTVFQNGFERAVLIGTDIPEITCNIIFTAFNVLKTKKVAVGPASDGGYYLIGFQKSGFSKHIFNHIEWSTASVFEQTLAHMGKKGVSYECLQKLEDIDTCEDLNALALRVKKGQKIGKRTIEMLEQL